MVTQFRINSSKCRWNLKQNPLDKTRLPGESSLKLPRIRWKELYYKPEEEIVGIWPKGKETKPKIERWKLLKWFYVVLTCNLRSCTACQYHFTSVTSRNWDQDLNSLLWSIQFLTFWITWDWNEGKVSVTYIWSAWPAASAAPATPAAETHLLTAQWIRPTSACAGACSICLRSCRCGVWTPVQSIPSPAVWDDHRLCWRSLRLKPFAGVKLKWEWERERESEREIIGFFKLRGS